MAEGVGNTDDGGGGDIGMADQQVLKLDAHRGIRPLLGQRLEVSLADVAGEERPSLAPAVEHHHRRAGEGRAQVGRGGMGHVMGYVAHDGRIEVGKQGL